MQWTPRDKQRSGAANHHLSLPPNAVTCRRTPLLLACSSMLPLR